MAIIICAFSCRKDDTSSDTSTSEGGSGSSSGSSTSTSSSTAQYTQNSTLDTYTALWCHACPQADDNTKQLINTYGSRLIPISIHNPAYGASNPDVLSFPNDAALTTFVNKFLVPRSGGLPTQILNRTGDMSGAISSNQVAALLTKPSSVGLAISSQLDGQTLAITVKYRFAKPMSGSKLAVYVLEDGIALAHANLDGSTNSNYVNDNVLRTFVTDPLGITIPANTAAAQYNTTFKVNVLSQPIPHPIADTGFPSQTATPAWVTKNLKIVAMVVDSKNSLLNAQQAKVGQTQDFQIVTP
mgnify:CR=1 FL=1